MPSLTKLLKQVRACTICADDLPLGPRPVLQMERSAKILIVGQAPGTKVHESGIPFDDASGKRLREWMGIDREIFYDANQIAILPMGFCYPGRGKSGDLPPRPECVKAWREPLLAQLPNIKLTLVLGQYAQDYHLQHEFSTLTELVRAWRNFWPEHLPLPHPSPRNNIWLAKNSWFESDVLPSLKERVAEVLSA